MLDAFNFLVSAGDSLGAMKTSEKFVAENFVDKSRFARAGDTGDDSHKAEWELCGDVFEVVFASANDGKVFAVAFFSGLGSGNSIFTREEATSDAVWVFGNFFGCADGDDLSALAEPIVYEPSMGKKVGEHGGAHFYTIGQRKGLQVGSSDEFVVVALVEPNARFVEYIEDSGEARANLSCQANALGFAARESVGGTTEFEIAETDICHERDAFFDFFEDGLSDEFFGFGKFEVGVEERESLSNIHAGNIDNVHAVDGDGEDYGLETSAVTSGTLAFAHEALDVFTHEVGLGFFVTAFKIRNNTFVGGLVFVTIAESDFVFFIASAVKKIMEVLFGEVLDRSVSREAMTGADSSKALEPPGVLINAVIWTDSAFGDGEVGVEHEIGIDFHTDTETSTSGAGTFGGIE